MAGAKSSPGRVTPRQTCKRRAPLKKLRRQVRQEVARQPGRGRQVAQRRIAIARIGSLTNAESYRVQMDYFYIFERKVVLKPSAKTIHPIYSYFYSFLRLFHKD